MVRFDATRKPNMECSLGSGCFVLAILLLVCSGCEPAVPEQAEVDQKVEEVITVVVTATGPLEPTTTLHPSATPSPSETPKPSHTFTPSWTPTRPPSPTPDFTPTPERIEAQVVEVVDGDTIKVDIGGDVHTVRYIGIDCPETLDPNSPVECMGPEATEVNRQLVEGEAVYLEKDVSETDRYGRLLRYVFLGAGTLVNAELVKRGYAQVSTYPPDVKYQDLFLEAQQEAREGERGLWGATPTPVPPSATPIPPSPGVGW